MSSIIQQLQQSLDQCLLVDRHPLGRKLQTLKKRLADNQPSDKLQTDIEQRIASSKQRLLDRKQAIPDIEFPDLPVSEKRADIAQAIEENQVVVIAGETGSGKTTQLPKICLELGRGVHGMIGHTQPRRLAARSVAQRIADELQTPLGQSVGYQVRFTDQVSDNSHIKLMTDGILLAEIQNDKFLNRYDTIIIDEAHERSLNIDFLLGYLKQLLPKRPDLKLIITSATIDVDSFAKHFSDKEGKPAPVIEVSGRTYPVETLYRPMNDLSEEGDLANGIEAAITELLQQEGNKKGDILIFLSGEADIREVSRQLRHAAFPHCEILPLYARLSATEQNRVFETKNRRGRRIILATNVAETSLTVPGIRYVIDPGYARISRYSYRTKVQRLPIEPISQASANQRKGRCGRVEEGVCIRLYDEDDFNSRPEFTDPEIRRTNLASVILQMLGMRIGDVGHFPFVDPPDRKMINDGFKLLEELGAVDKKQKLTPAGKLLNRFPIDPRLSRILLAAGRQSCLSEILIIVSALSIQDPRERPAEKRQASDEKHRRFWHKESDFLALVNLWNYYEEKRQELSQSQLRKLCQREFISFLRMREWRDIHHQLRLTCRELKLVENKKEASYEIIHKSLLSGLLSHIANLDDEREYLGARNRKLKIFPGSSQFKKTPKWLVAAEIAETTQVYARICARIDPVWLLGINDDLFKRNYTEPHWQQRTGRVMAYERLSLYGLVISDRKRIHYGPIDSKLSRELLIRGALVEGHINQASPSSRAPFFTHNREIIADIENMEAKSRRRDILVDDQRQFDFYNERVANHIITMRHFDKWRKDIEKERPKLLFMNKELLMQHSATDITELQFPDSISSGDLTFSVTYHFEPGHDEDGATVTVPVALLNRVPAYRFDWLVPGMLRDKCIALVKTLPKQLRKKMVPVPDYVDKVLARIKADDVSLLEVLSRELKSLADVVIDLDAWQPDQLDSYYRMNIRIIDANGNTLGQGRNLDALLSQFKGQATETIHQEVQSRFQSDNITQWDFGELPLQHQFKQAGVTVTSYPALVDCKTSVAIELKDYSTEAELSSRRGLVRLFMLQMPQQLKSLRKELLQGNHINLQLAGLAHMGEAQHREQWLDDLLYVVFYRVFLEGKPLTRNEDEFKHHLASHKSEIVPEAQALSTLLVDIASRYNIIRKQLKKANELAWAMAVADIKQQLTMLFGKGFIADTPYDHLQQYPRYLEAISQRIEKLRGHFQRDKQLSLGLSELTDYLKNEWSDNETSSQRSELLVDYRWLLEEYRVSLFAQQLKTRQPVSEKRLRELWKQVKQSLLDLSS